MIVGVPRETFPGERRVALVPTAISALTKAGLDILVERGAGGAAVAGPANKFRQGPPINPWRRSPGNPPIAPPKTPPPWADPNPAPYRPRLPVKMPTLSRSRMPTLSRSRMPAMKRRPKNSQSGVKKPRAWPPRTKSPSQRPRNRRSGPAPAKPRHPIRRRRKSYSRRR
ncbi:MAG: hypothetical protein IIC06_06335 [Proteobacteria bacterium]|nr:hypothetical protein [Pseudomonadota bacterium]